MTDHEAGESQQDTTLPEQEGLDCNQSEDTCGEAV